jgi:hypothetical protein
VASSLHAWQALHAPCTRGELLSLNHARQAVASSFQMEHVLLWPFNHVRILARGI